MNKVQSYIYIVVIVVILLAVTVVWNARKVDQPPAVSPQPSDVAAPEISIKYNNDGSIDTSDWLTFRHEVYPYEIRYPKGMEIVKFPLPTSPTAVKDALEFSFIIALETHYLDIYVDNITFSEEKVSLGEYLTSIREQSLKEPSDGVPMSISTAESIHINGWSGYQDTLTYETGRGNDVMREVFVLSNDVLYRITYREKDAVAQTMLQTLRFLD